MNREELAWAAGLFDGEGTVGFYQIHGSRHSRMRVTIGQTDEAMLIRFNQAVGGFGTISGPTLIAERKPFWVLNIYGFEQGQATISFLWTWLSQPKREQARGVLTEAAAYHKTVRSYVRKNQGFK